MPRHIQYLYRWLALNIPRWPVYTAAELCDIPSANTSSGFDQALIMIRKYRIR
jgi:hypothetical protein